ncbi:MAG: regulator of chromosome condensation 1 [Amphiamblys sp. WSBS2006]|nr:MAG: regulator of chromosome condensation 1 [Amphiamblys sp. WSBS2006]
MASVYVAGSGDCGQLGLGEDVLECNKPRKIDFFDDKNIVSVAAGGLHSLVLSGSGEVYSWGCNDDSALGHTEPEFSVGRVSLPERIVSIACGDSISVAVAESSRVYTWGTFRDSGGIVGHSKETEIQKTPIGVKLKGRVEDVSVGTNHVMVTTDDGKIYSWGTGQQGQLGRRIIERHKKTGLQPVSVTPFPRKNFRKVACGSYHSLCFDGAGRVYSCGLNNFGQLGHGDFEDRRNFDEIGEKIVEEAGISGASEIACGEHHSLLVDGHGSLFAFGRGDYGQLGCSQLPETLRDNDGRERVFSTKPVWTGLKDVACVSAGGLHSIAVDKSGAVFVWGYGEMGQLGNGAEKDVSVPERIFSGERVLQAAGGGQHSIFLVKRE